VAKPDIGRFDCPNCGVKYKLVRDEAHAKRGVVTSAIGP
jgi:predicted RNA-binding Zn-ribbon protein involved in translation (DUF1610 family)